MHRTWPASGYSALLQRGTSAGEGPVVSTRSTEEGPGSRHAHLLHTDIQHNYPIDDRVHTSYAAFLDVVLTCSTTYCKHSPVRHEHVTPRL
jgi:hypothetical protein